MSEPQDVKGIAALAVAAGPVHSNEGNTHVPFVVVPEGYKKCDVTERAESAFLDEPRWKEGMETVIEPDSFIAYVNKHQISDATEVFVHRAQATVMAHIDGHKPDAAGFRLFSVVLKLQLTDDFKAWQKVFSAGVKQVALAELFEDRIHTIAEPSGADLLQATKKLNITRRVDFTNACDLENGSVQLQYTNDTGGAAGPKGEFEIPSELTLYLPIYEGTKPVELKVKIRYRLDEDNRSVVFFLRVVQMDEVIRTVFDSMLNEIEKETKLSTYIVG